MTLLTLTSVRKQYGRGSAAVLALDDIDLTVNQGDFLCIAGPSGSGKSTLLNLVGLLDQPSAGTITINGEAVDACSRTARALMRRRLIGFVFQAFNLIPVLTAWENVEYSLLLQGCPARERRQRISHCLAQVGLDDRMHSRVSKLSGGQQQRVAIARAIVSAPRLVLADEPTANLDTGTGATIIDLFEQINREQGTTFLFSSHDPRIISRAHRVISLVDGRVQPSHDQN